MKGLLATITLVTLTGCSALDSNLDIHYTSLCNRGDLHICTLNIQGNINTGNLTYDEAKAELAEVCERVKASRFYKGDASREPCSFYVAQLKPERTARLLRLPLPTK